MIRAAGAVIYNPAKGFLLIHQKNSGDWELAKGKLEDNESWGEAAKREIREETGLSVTFIDGFEHDEEYLVRGKDPKTARYYLALTEEEPVLSREHTDYAWLAPNAAVERITHESRKNVLREAIAFLKTKELL